MAAKIKVDRAEFARLADWTNKQLAERFRVNETTISRIRKETGTSTAVRVTPERMERLELMVADGWSFEEITRTEGADRSTLNRHFPGKQWTAQQRIAHQSAVRPIHRKLRRSERMTAMNRAYGNAA